MKFLTLLLAVIWSLPLSAAEVVDRVVAIVGGELITLSDVKNFTSQGSTKDPLEALIREKLLKQEIERLGLQATEQDIKSAIQDVLQRNGVTLEGLRAELSKKGMPFEKYKNELGDQITKMKFMGQVIFPRIRVTEDEIVGKSANSSDEARFKARLEILESRTPEEMSKYLNEVRDKTYVEIKK